MEHFLLAHRIASSDFGVTSQLFEIESDIIAVLIDISILYYYGLKKVKFENIHLTLVSF